jgi:hypothetical protein
MSADDRAMLIRVLHQFGEGASKVTKIPKNKQFAHRTVSMTRGAVISFLGTWSSNLVKLICEDRSPKVWSCWSRDGTSGAYLRVWEWDQRCLAIVGSKWITIRVPTKVLGTKLWY